MNRNRILIVRKHAPTLVYPIFMLYFIFVVAPVKIIRYLKAKQGRFIPLLGKAIWWNMNNKTDSHKFYSPAHKIFKN